MIPRMLALVVLLGVMSIPGSAVVAQDPFMGNEAFLELLRSDVGKETTAILTNTMQFSADEAAIFWPLYKAYTDKVDGLADRRIELIKQYAKKIDTMSDEEADDIANEWLDIQKSRTEALGALYNDVASALSPSAALKVVQLEHRFNLVIDMQIANELPMVE
ncbi:MAG: hypothetical protein P8Y44_07965 [Acidobacteriota bacterium]